MTVSKTSLLNLTRYSADTDAWARTDFDSDNAELEARVGPLTEKPAGASVTAAANVTSSSTKSYKRGNVAIVSIDMTATGAVAAGATLFTVPAGHRPPSGVTIDGTTLLAAGSGVNVVPVRVDSAGVVTAPYALAATTTYRGQLVIPL